MTPSARIIAAVLGWAAFGLAAGVWPVLHTAWVIAGVILLALVLTDLVLLSSLRKVKVERVLPLRMAQGAATECELILRNPGSRPVRVSICEGVPPSMITEDMPWQGSIPPGLPVSLPYKVTPEERGRITFFPARLRMQSPLRLWERFLTVCGESTVPVYPNYEPVVRHALLALAHQETAAGIQSRRRMGASREFHQLRDYHEGDPLSRVDWKATSRRLSLISREYREQRNQNIILAIDCGRRLRAMEDGVPQFDHALNALLLLAFVALRQGDNVGILGFGEQTRYLAPVRGGHAITRILDHLYDYGTSDAPSDFSGASRILMERQKSRAMVIMLTNLRAEDGAELFPALRLLRRRHLVVLASLQDAALAESLRTEPATFPDALRAAAARLQANERALTLENLRAAGADTLDTSTGELPIALANLYLSLKRSGRL